MKLQFSFKFVKTHGQGEIDSVRQFYRSRPIVKRNYPSLCVLSTSLSNHGLFPVLLQVVHLQGRHSFENRGSYRGKGGGRRADRRVRFSISLYIYIYEYSRARPSTMCVNVKSGRGNSLLEDDYDYGQSESSFFSTNSSCRIHPSRISRIFIWSISWEGSIVKSWIPKEIHDAL